MSLLNFDPGYGLWGLGLVSFLAATILPGGSEFALFALIQHDSAVYLPALIVSTAANAAGGMVSWWCGRYLPRWQKLENLPHKDNLLRWGSPVLLLAWVPLMGDALCIAAGWLRLHWLACCGFMAIGKFVRYWLIAQSAMNF